MDIVTLGHFEVCNECGAELAPGTKARRYGTIYYCDAAPGKHPGPHGKPGGYPSGRRQAPTQPADQATDAPMPAAADHPVTREDLAHLLEGLAFVISSTLEQLRK